MKTASAPVIALLNAAIATGFSNVSWCDLYTITLQGGTVIRYTDHDVAVTFGGNTYAIGPLIKRSKVKVTVGVQVDDMTMMVSAPSTVQVNSKPLIAFIAGGGLDGARVAVSRLYTSSWAAAPAGTIIKFSGKVGPIQMGRNEATITVHSDTIVLDTMLPRNVWQPSCGNTLFDSQCLATRSSFTVSGTVSTSSTTSLVTSGLAQAASYFDLGIITFTSGPNNGLARTVKHFNAGGVIEVLQPLPFAPASGNTFTIIPGCDKKQATCSNKFSNLIHFRGMPFVPVNETVQ